MVVEEEEEEEEEDEEGPRSFIMAHYHTLDTHSSVIHVLNQPVRRSVSLLVLEARRSCDPRTNDNNWNSCWG